MKEEVLNKFVETMIGMLQDASAFAKNEIPQICKEIILYGRIKETFAALSCFLCVGVFAWLIRKALKTGDEDVFIPGTIYFGVGVFGFSVGGWVCLNSAILAWVAPRLYMLDYFKGLLK